jgi:3-oxoisoapionate decarboxylase
MSLSRRQFLASSAAAAASLAARPLAAQAANPLGLDNFAVRAMGWKALELVDYAASLAVDSLFISDLDAFESLEEPHLATVRAHARDRGIALHVGTWSICPTSKAFRPNRGSAEEHLATGIRVARALGSPALRVILGTLDDRLTDGGIDRHIEATVQVCRSQRSRAVDAGVKIAVENHAGDMHSTELVRLIEAAGPDYVGASLDMGNALWALEDPLDNLERLAPYTLNTSMRDSAVWQSERGARIAWTAMGEGDIDLKAYFARFRELCPGVPVHVETISGFNREFAYLDPQFWKAWPALPARAFAPFLAIARRGRPRDAWQPPPGEERKQAEQAYQRGELEQSLIYCRHQLGLGRRQKLG